MCNHFSKIMSQFHFSEPPNNYKRKFPQTRTKIFVPRICKVGKSFKWKKMPCKFTALLSAETLFLRFFSIGITFLIWVNDTWFVTFPLLRPVPWPLRFLDYSLPCIYTSSCIHKSLVCETQLKLVCDCMWCRYETQIAANFAHFSISYEL